jgi:hypothetical protein
LWGHMECFKKLIDQYGLDFPKSVRTAAANYYYGSSRESVHGQMK